MPSFQQALMPVADQLKEFADSNPVLFVSFLNMRTLADGADIPCHLHISERRSDLSLHVS